MGTEGSVQIIGASMTRAVIFAIVVELVAGCSKHGNTKLTGDADISNRMIGTWKVDETNSNGITARGQDSFFQNGTFAAKGAFSRGDRHVHIAFAGTWQINQGVLVETITNSDNANLHIGLITRDKIVSIDSRRYVFRDDDGKLISRDRIGDTK